MAKPNIFSGAKRKRRGKFGTFLTVLIFAFIFGLFYLGIVSLTTSHQDEALLRAQQALVRSAVQFYALEGRYPPTYEYLINRFGLQIDTDRFIVHYTASGSNIMPTIVVLPRNPAGGQ